MQIDILHHLERAYYDVQRGEEKNEDWWPAKQSESSLWMWATFLRVSDSLCQDVPGNEYTLTAKPSYHETNPTLEDWESLVEKNWNKSVNNSRAIDREEVLVDFTVLDWKSQDHIVLTAESEMHAAHGVGYHICGNNGYAWDFYKLLLVPSPIRLYFAQVGSGYGRTGKERRDDLVSSIDEILRNQAYSKNLLRPGDFLSIVILSPDCAEEEWTDMRLIEYLKEPNGSLHRKKPDTPWSIGSFVTCGH